MKMKGLKGQGLKIFNFMFHSCVIFPPPSDSSINGIQKLINNLQGYVNLNVPSHQIRSVVWLGSSNGNASKTKANESFDSGVFFYIEAKRIPSIVNKLFSKQSEHIR
jgi:hypothetical protein